MRLKLFLLVPFIFILSTLFAQSDFRPGYVVLNNSDTLLGQIDYRGDMKMSQLCSFIKNGSDSICVFNPNDIIEFRFIDSKRYVSRGLENGNIVFLEYLVKGELNVYYYRDQAGKDIYLMDKINAPLKEIPYYKKEVVDEKGYRREYSSQKHKALMNIYTSDAKNFSSEINKVVEPNHPNLIKFASKYHKIVCDDSDCIIYSKTEPLINASVELIGGQTFFYKAFDEYNTNLFGAYILLNLPRSNERLYLKTGFHMQQFRDSVNLNYVVIPSQIQYEYSRSKLIPKVFLGFNNIFVAKDYFWTLATGCGINYKISKRFYFASNVTVEFAPIGLTILEGYTDTYLSCSVNFGLRIDL